MTRPQAEQYRVQLLAGQDRKTKMCRPAVGSM